jgi:hypothetical protein
MHLKLQNAILNVEIEEEVYLKQPSTFICYGWEHFVCKLKKIVHGFKQAHQTWFETNIDTYF